MFSSCVIAPRRAAEECNPGDVPARSGYRSPSSCVRRTPDRPLRTATLSSSGACVSGTVVRACATRRRNGARWTPPSRMVCASQRVVGCGGSATRSSPPSPAPSSTRRAPPARRRSDGADHRIAARRRRSPMPDAPRRAAPRARRRQAKKKAPRPPAGGTGGGGICQWTPVRAYVPGVVARLRCRDAGIGVTVARSGRCAVVVDADDAPDVVPAIRLRRSSRSAPPSPPRAACSASRTPICRARCGAASTPHPPARRRRCASSSTPGATRSGSMTTGASSSPTPGADDAPARAALTTRPRALR